MRPLASAALFGAAVLAFAALAAAQATRLERMRQRPLAAPSGSAHWPRSGQEELAEQFRKHRPRPEELQTKLSELRASAGARRDAHRVELRSEFGSALNRKDVEDELRKHARRIAFLSRAKLVATTELDEPKRSATLARIDKLIATENARHESAVHKVMATAPRASATPTPAAPVRSTP